MIYLMASSVSLLCSSCLFAFLRDYAGSSCDVKENCVDLIFQKANKIKQIPERIRLSYEIRGNVKKFIEEYLMTPGSITQHWDEIVKKANDKKESTSIQKMCNALVCYDEYFATHEEIDLDAFLSCQGGSDFTFGNGIRHLDGYRGGRHGLDRHICLQGTGHSHPSFFPVHAHCFPDRIENRVILKGGGR